VQTPDEILDTELAGAPQARQVRASISPRLLGRGWSRLVDPNSVATTQSGARLGRNGCQDKYPISGAIVIANKTTTSDIMLPEQLGILT